VTSSRLFCALSSYVTILSFVLSLGFFSPSTLEETNTATFSITTQQSLYKHLSRSQRERASTLEVALTEVEQAAQQRIDEVIAATEKELARVRKDKADRDALWARMVSHAFVALPLILYD
jgi:hypothetical protein